MRCSNTQQAQTQAYRKTKRRGFRPKQAKNCGKFAIMRIELNIGGGLGYTIKNDMSKASYYVCLKKLFKFERTNISVFCIFLVNSKCYRKNKLYHAIIYKIMQSSTKIVVILFCLRITILEILPIETQLLRLRMESCCSVPQRQKYFSSILKY